MKNTSASVAWFLGVSLVGALLLGLAAVPLAAQAPSGPGPVRNAFVFTLRISGSGSDPASTVNSAISAAAQDWTYERTIDGWFEVSVTRRREDFGTGPRDVVEFFRKSGGRHQIVGSVSDGVRNYERWIGEGYETGVHADYTASETATWSGAIEAPDTGVVLDTTNKKWLLIFDPQFLLADYQSKMNFHGEAQFQPSGPAGFGEPWSYMTNDLSRRLAGEKKQIMSRYHAGESGIPSLPLEMIRNLPAKLDGPVPSGRIEYAVPRHPYAKGTWTMSYILDWSVRTELPDVELEVRCPNYETWRPTATVDSAAPGAGRAYGPGLNFAAELRRVDGNKEAPLPKIRSLEWRLANTSSEPGIAMNFPYRSDDKRLDMEIVAGDLTEPEDATVQAVVIRSPGEAINEATVFPYDWGGWTTLRVTATLDDGRKIQGILRGGAKGHGLKAIPVPATTPGSKIAWHWLRTFWPEWQSDADDRDKVPAGKPGVDGDGFSVYEEYRGFYTYFGDHQSLQPKTKDLFVRLNSLGKNMRGVMRFYTTSGLGPYFLRSDQLPRAAANDRVVNCNIGAGATSGPQTALYVVETVGFNTWTNPIPPGSRPRSVPSIEVKSDYQSFLSAQGLTSSAARSSDGHDLVESTLVRSMFQAVGVERPGPPGKIAQLGFVSAPEARDGKPHYVLDGHRVVIETEGGQDHAVANNNALVRANLNRSPGETPFSMPAYSVIIGTKGSAHSGPENCVMRDWFADLYQSSYVRDGIQVYKYTLGTERPGTSLGTTRSGTGINLSTNRPEPRYGDSKVAAPANRQLVVKDQAP